jgi:hypothetical protein
MGMWNYLQEPTNLADMALFWVYLLYAGLRFFHYNEKCTAKAKCNYLPNKEDIDITGTSENADAVSIQDLFYLAILHVTLLTLSALKVMHFF